MSSSVERAERIVGSCGGGGEGRDEELRVAFLEGVLGDVALHFLVRRCRVGVVGCSDISTSWVGVIVADLVTSVDDEVTVSDGTDDMLVGETIFGLV